MKLEKAKHHFEKEELDNLYVIVNKTAGNTFNSLKKNEKRADTMLSGLPQKLQNQIPGHSRTFLVIFQDCLRFFLLDLKFNIDYYSFLHLLFCTCD